MSSDEAFKGAGTKPGIEIWRIKEFKCLPLDKSEYGSFYQGDSYIVLRTGEFEDWDVHFWLGKDTTQTYELQKKLVHDVHFWLGEDASSDEYGTAAIKTVELDDSLGGLPVQHREVQDHESALFLSYFKKGIKYLLGGYDSGFNHVGGGKFVPRLFQCKGKRNVRVRQVALETASLNRGDVFILDGANHIYVWMPPKAGRLERIKGVHHANNIRDQERAGRGDVVVVDSDWQSCWGFWKHFGKQPDTPEDIRSAADGGVDGEKLKTDLDRLSLWRISDESGRMRVTKAGEKELSFSMLDSKDAFILDSASGGLFVWVGKGCSLEERKKAMAYASEYLTNEGRPQWSQVTRVLETAEPAMFTQWFSTAPPNRKWGAKPKLFECSDETGKLTVTQVEDFDQEDLDGDDVMILDTATTVYVWVGKGASDGEKSRAAEIAQTYLSSDAMPRPNGAKVAQLAQGHEPSDFTKHFKAWNPDANAFEGRTAPMASRQ